MENRYKNELEQLSNLELEIQNIQESLEKKLEYDSNLDRVNKIREFMQKLDTFGCEIIKFNIKD